MKIAVDGREVRPGVRNGIRRLVELFLEGLPEANPGAVAEFLPGPAATSLPVTLWWDQIGLPRRVRDADVLWSPYYKVPLTGGPPAVATVCDLHFLDLVGPARRALFRGLLRLYLSRAGAVVTISEHSRAAILAETGADPRRVVVASPAPARVFRTPPSPGPLPPRGGEGKRNTPYLVVVGPDLPHKNLSLVARALGRLDAATRPRLMVVGRDPAGYRRLREAARAAGLGAGEVEFTGVLEDQDLAVVYAGALAAVVPSLAEGFGMPAVEAMAAGTPVIAARAGALPETTGGAALLVDPRDVDGLADAIRILLRDERRAAELSAAGRARAAGLSAARFAASVCEALARAVNPK